MISTIRSLAMEILTRAEAKAAGKKYFFSSKPCQRGGHIAQRYVGNKNCIECNLDRGRDRWANRAEAARKDQNERRAKQWAADPLIRAAFYERSKKEKRKRRLDPVKRAKDNVQKLSDYYANHEHCKEMSRAYKSTDSYRQRIRARLAETKENMDPATRDARRAAARSYYRKNPLPANVAASNRRAAKLQRMPSWADRKAIKEIYMACRRISQETGVLHHVDHELPLQGKLVSGLHVPANLRIIPAVENIAKGNRYAL